MEEKKSCQLSVDTGSLVFPVPHGFLFSAFSACGISLTMAAQTALPIKAGIPALLSSYPIRKIIFVRCLFHPSIVLVALLFFSRCQARSITICAGRLVMLARRMEFSELHTTFSVE